MTCRLTDLKEGEKARVERVDGGGALRRRMMDMGIVPGVELEVIRRAPLGGPIQIRLKGYYLAMRRNECASIMLYPVNPNRESALASR